MEGVYVSASETILRHEFEEKGLYVFSVKRRGGFRNLSISIGPRRLNEQEFLTFNQGLATLLRSGMPLLQSLEILRQRVANETLKDILENVYERVKAGTALSEAFAECGNIVPAVYPASLLAGERSGALDGVIRRYVLHAKALSVVRRKMISALIYPTVLMVLMLVLLGIIVFQVVPAFSDFYASFDEPLPLSTQVIVAISNTLASKFWFLMVGLAVVSISVLAWLRQSGRGAQVDHMILKLPGIGPVVQKFATTKLARTLATLLGGGIPLVQSLQIASQSMTNRHMAGEVKEVGKRVRGGEAFASALLTSGEFPDVAIKMIEVGESTGALEDMLNSLADFYDEELETEVSRFITLFEPLLLVIMGIVVAAVVLALYMPLFELSTVVGG
jgi:type IV pilus assembly protein PilC